MRTIILLTSFYGIMGFAKLFAQTPVGADSKLWTVFNRSVDYRQGMIHLNASEGDGILWLNNCDFKNGTIEVDIKGQNIPGRSFVGVAFHGKNDTTFDAVYFRPFNFQNPEKRSHAVQYISIPAHDWQALRIAFPGKYENAVTPIPNADNWFHAKIVVNYPKVTVYVNGSEDATLEVDQISDVRDGKVGLWVGNGSEGWFRNFMITNP